MNLASIIDPHPDDDVALVSRMKPTTYGVLRAQVAKLRAGWIAQGVQPGDRVALLCGNNWYFVTGYLSLLGVGAVVVPLNPQSPAAELAGQLRAVDCSGVLVGPAGARVFGGVDRASVPSLRLVVATQGAAVADAVTYDDLMAGPDAPMVDREPSDLAALLFTSGTAGSPKAAMLTHGCLLANLEQTQQHPGRSIGANDCQLGVLPLSHIFGLNVVLGLTLHAGARVVIVERFDPASALEAVQNHEVTVICGAPPMWESWWSLPGVPSDAFKTVRLAVSGAARLSEDLHTRFETRFGVSLTEGYGLTEASPIVTSSAGDRPRLGSVGVPLPGVDVRLVDADGSDALQGDPGEVWVRGPNVFAGYWNDPEATARTIDVDGWLHTGDVAVSDDDGYLYLVDRAKDLIIVSGFNVYPAEVEDVIAEHPGVAAVAVVGVEHPHTGEAVRAFVVCREGIACEEDDLIEHCADHLARYKCPQKITFVDELPVGTGGKVLRRALR